MSDPSKIDAYSPSIDSEASDRGRLSLAATSRAIALVVREVPTGDRLRIARHPKYERALNKCERAMKKRLMKRRIGISVDALH